MVEIEEEANPVPQTDKECQTTKIKKPKKNALKKCNSLDQPKKVRERSHPLSAGPLIYPTSLAISYWGKYTPALQFLADTSFISTFCPKECFRGCLKKYKPHCRCVRGKDSRQTGLLWPSLESFRLKGALVWYLSKETCGQRGK